MPDYEDGSNKLIPKLYCHYFQGVLGYLIFSKPFVVLLNRGHTFVTSFFTKTDLEKCTSELLLFCRVHFFFNLIDSFPCLFLIGCDICIQATSTSLQGRMMMAQRVGVGRECLIQMTEK